MENMSTTEPSCDIEIEIICEKCCRTCSKSFDEHVTMSPIFQVFTVGTNNKYKFNIADELNLLNIKIDKNDGLPQEVCTNCVTHFKKFFSFRMLCELSQIKLRNLYNPNCKINLDDLIKCETANDRHDFDQDNGASQIPLPSQKSVDESNLPNVLFPAFVNVTNMELEPTKAESTIQNDIILFDCANAVEFLPENEDNYSSNDDDRKSEASFSDAQPNHSDEEDCDTDNEPILEDINMETDVENTEKPKTPPNNSVNGPFLTNTEDESIRSNEIQKCSALIQTAVEQHVQEQSNNDTTEENHVNLNLFIRNVKKNSYVECISMCSNCNKYKYSRRIRADQVYCMEWKKNNTLIQSLETDYCCFYCNENFYSMTVLQDHVTKTHSYRKPFNCSSCDEKFMLYKNKTMHYVKRHAKETEINCTICNKKIKSKIEFYTHMRKHKLNNRTINNRTHDLMKIIKTKDIKLCDICKKYKFSKRFEKDKASCGIYKKNFRVPLNPDGDYICYYCNSNYDNESLLKVHMARDHSYAKPFNCKKCDKEFRSMSASIVHYIKRHKGILPYDECIDNDRGRETGFSDARSNHSDEEDCDAGNEPIVENSKMETDVENTEEPAKSSDKGYLSKDMEDNSIGSNEVQKCSVLIQTAMEQNDTTEENDVNLNLSNRNGKNELLFELIMCKICNKYKYNGRIQADQDYCIEWKKNNTLIQSLETDYCCFYCNENFYSMTVLQDHVTKTHSYRKPFNCSSCDEKFMLYKTKTRHYVKKHSKETEINCTICNKKIKSKVEFYSHLRNHKIKNRIINNDRYVLMNVVKKTDIKLCDICKKYKFSKRFEKDKSSCGIYKKNFRIPLNPDGDYICYYCNSNYDNESLLKDHMVNDHLYAKPFNCKKCDEKFPRLRERIEHYQKCHKDIPPYECSICDIKFTIERLFLKHRIFYHSHFKYECEICLEKFYAPRQLRHHKYSYSKIRTLKCKYCNQNNIDLHHLKLHKRELDNIAEEIEESGDKGIMLCNICKKYKFAKRFKEDRKICLPYKKNLPEHADGDNMCYYCNSNFENENLLKGHMLNDHSFEKPFKCIKCDEIFSSVPTRIEHYKKCHKEIDPFQCPICYIRLPNRNSSVVHRNRFHTDVYYECKICSKKFYTLCDFQGHTKYHIKIRKYKCKYCDKTFHQQSQVISHERVHTKEKPFMCETCGRQFRLREDYTKHLRIHTGENLSICEYCGESFPAVHLLNSHVKAFHFGVRSKRISQTKIPHNYPQKLGRYECPQCTKYYYSSQGFHRHLKMHDENRKYKCSQCSYSYTHLWGLTVHVRTSHPQVGVFVCHCGKEFPTQEQKIQHQKNVHKGKVYNCEYCDETFKTRIALVKHVRAHHNEKMFKCSICEDDYLSNYQLQLHTKRDHNTNERKQIEEDNLAEAKIVQQSQKD